MGLAQIPFTGPSAGSKLDRAQVRFWYAGPAVLERNMDERDPNQSIERRLDMLHQLGKHQFRTWALVALFGLVLLSTVVYMQNSEYAPRLPAFDSKSVTVDDEESVVPPSVDVLRAAKPDMEGASVPESTMNLDGPSVATLRAAKPDFSGASIPESTFTQPGR